MRQCKYDLAVAYRIYPKMSANPPPVCADDKFKLAELCLKSFKRSLGGLRVRVWALLNNCPPPYETLFTQLWAPEDLVLMRYPGVPPGTTLHEQTRILMEQADAEIVYFAEDDYFYLPGQFQLAVDFLKQNPDADFVTPYEHPDLHATDLHDFACEIRAFGGKDWGSRMSATHTFLAKRGALLEIKSLFDGLSRAFRDRTIPDLAMWMALTKRRVFNPFKFACWLIPHPFWAVSILYAWYYCWRQILFGRRYTLWIPRPSIATHMDVKLLAPEIDWPREFQTQLAGDSSAARKT